MEKLVISRGNANTSIRQLIDYGIVFKKYISGDRKEYFVAEKDALKWSMKIAIMRKKKELEPVMEVLKEISSFTVNEKSKEGKEFHKTVKDIQDLTEEFEQLANKIFNANQLLLKLFKLMI